MNVSIKKYRLFDLTLLAIIAIISEAAGELLHKALPGAGFYLSFSILVALIAMIRWGKWGALVYMAAGIPMVYLYQGNILQSIILFPISNLFIVLVCLLFRLIEREKIKENSFYIFTYILVAYLCVALGKGIATLIIAGEFSNSVILYFISQLFNMIMVFIAFLILKNREGLLDNMNRYLVEYN